METITPVSYRPFTSEHLSINNKTKWGPLWQVYTLSHLSSNSLEELTLPNNTLLSQRKIEKPKKQEFPWESIPLEIRVNIFKQLENIKYLLPLLHVSKEMRDDVIFAIEQTPSLKDQLIQSENRHKELFIELITEFYILLKREFKHKPHKEIPPSNFAKILLYPTSYNDQDLEIMHFLEKTRVISFKSSYYKSQIRFSTNPEIFKLKSTPTLKFVRDLNKYQHILCLTFCISIAISLFIIFNLLDINPSIIGSLVQFIHILLPLTIADGLTGPRAFKFNRLSSSTIRAVEDKLNALKNNQIAYRPLMEKWGIEK